MSLINFLHFSALKNNFAQFHKNVWSQQHESSSEKGTPENNGSEPKIAKNLHKADIEELKLKILNASLPFVPQHGWTDKTIALGTFC